MTWDWSGFTGDPQCLKWSRRDLETLERVISLVSGRTAVVQAGGNIGIFPKRLAADFETVYTFEPAAHLFADLMRNAPEQNILKFQAALGCDRKLVSLSKNRRDNSGRPEHDGLTHVKGSGAIPTLRIDDLALPACDLIYLDIEGFEPFALQGARETVARCRPVIAVEINRGIEHYGFTADRLREQITDMGYRHAFTKHSDEVFLPR